MITDITADITTERSAAIAALNDLFRSGQRPNLGRVECTPSVASLDVLEQAGLIAAIQTTSDFGEDPYGEHDFGCIKQNGTSYFWKIDYYESSLVNGHEDPTAADCVRVMTIMEASEY